MSNRDARAHAVIVVVGSGVITLRRNTDCDRRRGAFTFLIDDGVVDREAESAQTEPVEQEVERLNPVELQTVDRQPAAGVDGLTQRHERTVAAAGVDRVTLLLTQR